MLSNSLPFKGNIQGRLLAFAAVFLGLYALALSFSPAVLARGWDADYRWQHWAGWLVWSGVFFWAHRQTNRRLPGHNPFLLPLAAMLSGWGLLSVWRLFPEFGLRQTFWLGIAGLILIAGLRLPSDLKFFRRYKYLWLTSGLLLTSLTVFFGTNPLGAGPRLWLGCCGLYMQPSEPLKLLLIVYLAAFLAGLKIDQKGHHILPASRSSFSLLPLIAPTLIMAGLALLLLLVQRDLGTASIFIFLYSVIVYVATGRKRIPLAGIIGLSLAGAAGYWMFDLVRIRIDAWLNPWLDPSGRSYQIIQSLLAVASGGVFGRGPGLGSPGLVPVPHSDFIFASIAEEAGFLGAAGLLLVIALFAHSAFSVAMKAPDAYRRYLAAGLAAYLVGQSILIVGGNLRLLPLTGVTLPFVSYGGSSLVTSFLTLLLLLHISSSDEERSVRLSNPRPYLELNAFLLAGIAAAVLVLSWWSVWRRPELVARTDNPRRSIAGRHVPRGEMFDREDRPLYETSGQPGSLARRPLYPELSHILGYTHPAYGQSGLEASLDPYLRGLKGYRGLEIWWNELLYGQPPAGLDARLTLDLDLQRLADSSLNDHDGALVLLNAESGEILAMVSHPSFDSNRLAEDWERLIQDPSAPLLNRATQGLYTPGPVLGPLLLAKLDGSGVLPPLPQSLSYTVDGRQVTCTRQSITRTWTGLVAGGCPSAAAALGEAFGSDQILDFYASLGLFDSPELHLPAGSFPGPEGPIDPAAAAVGKDILVSPLQVALAAAALSNDGVRPAPYLVTGYKHHNAGWITLPPLEEARPVIAPDEARAVAAALAGETGIFWQTTAYSPSGESPASWYIGGTLPSQSDSPFVLALLLEDGTPEEAAQIGQTVLEAAVQPE